MQTLARELDNNKGIAERRQGLQEQLQEKQNTLQGLDALITQRQQELHDLLSQVEARDEQEFQDMGRILEQTSQLQENLQNLAGSLKRGSGYSNLQQAIELYSAWNKEQLTAEIHSLEQDIEEKEKRRQEISSRIGELQAKRENLASREDVSRLRQEEESLKEDLQQAALSWSRYTLALHLLRQAKSRYEQEQQPQVLRTAGRFLARITGGAYTGIYAPLGQSQVFALDDTGQTREPEELSRGTAEQLYLALRFGYVENAAEHGERLPIIMDDILVNFDPRRAQNAAAAIHELAQKNQILYFTCHPQTLSYLQQASTQTAVYEMKAGCVQRKQ